MFPLRDNVRPAMFPMVNTMLIILNVFVFLIEITMDYPELIAFFNTYGIIPFQAVNVFNPDVPFLPTFMPFITSIFVHGGLGHVLANMWFLWIFGDNIEDRLGHFRYFCFYILAGLAGGIFHVASTPDSLIPAIGASGAVAGVLGAYMLSLPSSSILTFIPIPIIGFIREIPAVVFIGIWFLMQLLNGFAASGAYVSNVAWWAHIGGFLMGMFLIKMMSPREFYRHY